MLLRYGFIPDDLCVITRVVGDLPVGLVTGVEIEEIVWLTEIKVQEFDVAASRKMQLPVNIISMLEKTPRPISFKYTPVWTYMVMEYCVGSVGFRGKLFRYVDIG